MAERLLSAAGRGLFALGGGAMVAQNCLFNIDGGEQGVMFNRLSGVSEKMYGEGTHFKVPWFQSESVYTVRTRAKDVGPTTTGTKDLQTVEIKLRLLYRPDAERLFQIHRTLGNTYQDKVLEPVGNEVMKTILAQYDAEQLMKQRDKVSMQIRKEVRDQLKTFDVVLDDVSITHLAFSREFSKSVEDKQVAEQQAERQKFIVQMAEQEKLAKIKQAEGEAEAAKMVSAALAQYGKGFVEVKRIDAAKEIADTLSKSNNVMYLPAGGNGANLLLNMGGGGGGGK
jgi:prohibitin 1